MVLVCFQERALGAYILSETDSVIHRLTTIVQHNARDDASFALDAFTTRTRPPRTRSLILG